MPVHRQLVDIPIAHEFRTGRRLPKPAVMLQHGAMQALIAGDAERDPRLPNVVKVRGC